jgi:hypothetical protein
MDVNLFQNLGPWIAFLFSLMVFSAIAGDNILARLSQHILVGAGLGYAAIMAIQYVLWPRLLQPLLQDNTANPWLYVLLALGLLLFVAGIDRTYVQTVQQPILSAWWRRTLFGLGRIPVALLIGVGLGTGIVGAIQGTLIPQYWRAAQMAFDPLAPASIILAGLLTLLITTATLLYLYVDPHRYLEHQPGYIRRLMYGWIWLGQRSIWLAAGLIFARLMAARLSLLIARIQFFVAGVFESRAWQWVESLAQSLGS